MAEGTTGRIGNIRDPDLNFEALVIFDEPSGDTPEIQRSFFVDQRDIAAGMDNFRLVRSA